MMQQKRILLLKGGWNRERDVSLGSGDAVAASLRKQGYVVEEHDISHDLETFITHIKTFQPDVVANLLHGLFGEDGHVQGILEGMGIPHTSSSLLSSALAMNKPQAKIIFRAHNIPCAEDAVMGLDQLQKKPPFPYPFIIKPPADGSSVGVFIIKNEHELAALSHNDDPALKDPLMIEPYIHGRELSIPVIHHDPIGILELRPKEGFYDYHAKYTDGLVEHICPAQLDKSLEEKLKDYSAQATKALGCEGVCRVDWRLDDRDGKATPYILEINTQPGMVSLSIVPEVVQKIRGWSFDALTSYMVEHPRIPHTLGKHHAPEKKPSQEAPSHEMCHAL